MNGTNRPNVRAHLLALRGVARVLAGCAGRDRCLTIRPPTGALRAGDAAGCRRDSSRSDIGGHCGHGQQMSTLPSFTEFAQ